MIVVEEKFAKKKGEIMSFLPLNFKHPEEANKL